MDTLIIVSGFILLLAGSQLFWFVTAVAGLIVGDYLFHQSFKFYLTWSSLTNSIKFSLLGVVFAITAKPFAVLSSGFILGGFLSYHLPETLNWKMDWYSWPYFVLGGMIVVVLMWLSYAFSYILVTALSGAVLIIQYANFGSLDKNILLLLFLLLGLTSQYLLLNYNEPVMD
jgi:hypothetical protein